MPRVLEYRFRLQFFCSHFDELLECVETWGSAISLATCKPGNRSEHIHVYCGHQRPSSVVAPACNRCPRGGPVATTLCLFSCSDRHDASGLHQHGRTLALQRAAWWCLCCRGASIGRRITITATVSVTIASILSSAFHGSVSRLLLLVTLVTCILANVYQLTQLRSFSALCQCECKFV